MAKRHVSRKTAAQKAAERNSRSANILGTAMLITVFDMVVVLIIVGAYGANVARPVGPVAGAIITLIGVIIAVAGWRHAVAHVVGHYAAVAGAAALVYAILPKKEEIVYAGGLYLIDSARVVLFIMICMTMLQVINAMVVAMGQSDGGKWWTGPAALNGLVALITAMLWNSASKALPYVIAYAVAAVVAFCCAYVARAVNRTPHPTSWGLSLGTIQSATAIAVGLAFAFFQWA